MQIHVHEQTKQLLLLKSRMINKTTIICHIYRRKIDKNCPVSSMTLDKYVRFLPIWMFNNPPVVDILKDITCDLLLMTAAPPIRISDWINMSVGVKPARFPRWQRVGVSQGDLGAIGHIEGLSFGEGSQTSLTIKKKIFNTSIMLQKHHW